jgi:hypothetical protein
MLDLASRGEIAFRQESELLGLQKKVGVEDRGRAPTRTRRPAGPQRRPPLGPGGALAERASRRSARHGYIEPDELLAFGSRRRPEFNEALETRSIRNGWFREKPSASTARWAIRGTIA